MSIRLTNLFVPFLYIFSLGIFFFSNSMVGQQDTLYYNTKWKITTKDSAAYFRPPVSKVGDLYKKEDYYISGKLQMSALSSRPDKDIWEGKVTWYNEDGTVLQEGSYKNNRLDGEYVSTFNGKKLKAKFESGRMVSGKTNGKLKNNRQYYTEMRGDTILNIIYENDIKGVRYERYSVGRKYDVLVKYFDMDGNLIGTRQTTPDGYPLGLEVTYYKTPMRPMEIKYYPNGTQLGSTFYYCKDQIREEFNSDNELTKTFYGPNGEVIGRTSYTYDNNALQPVDGREYIFYSSYNEYKAELIRSIREYSDGKLQKEELFYENQKPMTSTTYTDGAKELQVSYNEKGEEIARMVYENWSPRNGTEINGNRETTYADGKLVEEINYYFDTKLVFSRKTPTKETYFGKDGSELGTLYVNDDNGYYKPMNGNRYTINYDGDITEIERYENSYAAQRTSFRKRQVGKDEWKTFKKIEVFEPNGYKRTKEIRFYSNGKKQSEIVFDGYDKSTGSYYDEQEVLLGEYDYKTKEGSLYEFFGDSDQLKRMEVRKDGQQIKLQRYDYGTNTSFGEINPVLVEDIDATCCASFYSKEGELLGKVKFKDGQPWEGTYYDVKKRTSNKLKEGKRNGTYLKYDYDRSILEEGTFEADKEEGLFTFYDYNGQLVKTENYTNGTLDGIAKYYDKDKSLIGEMTYTKGVPMDGTRIVSDFYNKNAITENYVAGKLVKRISYDDNGKRVSDYKDGKETTTTAYHGDTDKKRLTYAVKGADLDGIVIRYDLQGEEQYRSIFEAGKLKEGTVMLTGSNVRGNPEYIVLTREPDVLYVAIMGKNDKVLFSAKENLAFGTATVFMQSLDVYMDYLGPNRLY